MPSDQLVHATVILEAMADLKRRGIEKILQDLEATEPDLANVVLEEFSLLHKRLLDTGGRPKQVRRLQNQVERLVVVCILSLQKAHYRLWQREAEDTPLAKIDLPDPPPTSSTPSPREDPDEQV